MRANQEFQKFFSREGINKDASFLLAISGGLDSMVLMRLCQEMDLRFSVAHCNFSLRGEESDKDQALVEKMGAKADVKVFSKRFDTSEYAGNSGLSVQMAARELRYAWFEELVAENGFNYLVTAHHKNDNAETILFNLVKGTGIAGLRGILPVNSNLLRPLLGISKKELREYALQNEVEWREDASNEETKYHRNFIRKEVIPLLEKINPSFLDTLGPSLERIRLSEKIWNDFMETSRKELITKEKDYWVIEKKAMDSHGSAYLYELIREYGFSMEQCKNMMEASGSGRSFNSEDYEITEDRGRLLLTPKKEETDAIEIQEKEGQINWGKYRLELAVENGGSEEIIQDMRVGQFDFDQLKFPLHIRSWRAGDYFFPLGMKGKKKISDFMIDRKIPLNLKKGVGLLCSGEEVIWVIGYQIDDRFKITENTRRIYQVKICNV